MNLILLCHQLPSSVANESEPVRNFARTFERNAVELKRAKGEDLDAVRKQVLRNAEYLERLVRRERVLMPRMPSIGCEQ